MERLLHEQGRMELRAEQLELAGDQEHVVLKMVRGAIASPDLAVQRGFVEFAGVLGHQGVGIVERGGSLAVGTRVAVWPHVVCAACEYCKAGLSTHCAQRQVMGLHKRDGVFATRVAVPARNVVGLPAALDDDRATMACLVASALATAGMVRVEGKPYVTVLGDGPIGLLVAQVLARRNASVRLLGTHASRLATCEKWGVKHRHISDAGTHRDQHMVFDCTGSPLGTRLAMQMVRPRGAIVIKAWPLPVEASRVKHERLNLSAALSAEATIVGSGPGTLGNLEEAVELLTQRKVDVEPLMSRRFALRQYEHAYTQAAMPEAACMLLDLSSGQ